MGYAKVEEKQVWMQVKGEEWKEHIKFKRLRGLTDVIKVKV